MRVNPDMKVIKRKASYFMLFKKWLAIAICFIAIYFFLFKIVLF